jgi:hypothetical protein
MVYRGKVKNGVVVLESGTGLPDASKIHISTSFH